MNRILFFAASLISCGGETGFSESEGTDNVGGVVGSIAITPLEIVFEDIDAGLPYSEPFKITSIGEAELVIYKVDMANAGGGAFTLAQPDNPNDETWDGEEYNDIVLAPEDSREFKVVVDMDADGSVQGSIRIKSNDTEPDSDLETDVDPGEIKLPLTAWTYGSTPPDDTGR